MLNAANTFSQAARLLVCMSSTPASYDQLIEQFVNDHLLPGEVDQFFLFLEEADFRAQYAAHIDADLLKQSLGEWLSKRNSDQLYQRILKEGGIEQPQAAIRKPFYSRTWFRYAAAVLILAAGTTYFLMNRQQPEADRAKLAEVPQVKDEKPIPPAANKAVLTLSNGQQVSLEENAAGIINDGSVAIQQKDGQLIYSKDAALPASAMNTITTPNGGQYQLLLSDGSRVWLNAGSSITYPATFTGEKREVSIRGEAYFEIAGNKNKPFIVNTANEQITVLGTSFNVNSYADEPFTKTTLVEGSVKVNDALLKPGQALLDGKIVTANVQQDIAWKTGYFDFTGLPFDRALRQLARWYDIEIVYQNGTPRDLLTGKMERNMSLSDAIAGLNGMLANVKVRLDKRTILVKSLQQ